MFSVCSKLLLASATFLGPVAAPVNSSALDETTRLSLFLPPDEIVEKTFKLDQPIELSLNLTHKSITYEQSTGVSPIIFEASDISPEFSQRMFDSVTFNASPKVDWQNEVWIELATVGGVIAGMQQELDGQLRQTVDQNRGRLPDYLSTLGEAVGDGLYVGPLLGATYLLGQFTDDGRLKRVAFVGAQALAATAFAVTTVKAVAQRDRPSDRSSPHAWNGIWSNGKINLSASFPSGHTATAFSLATVVASEYYDKPIVQITAFALAALTGLSRINDDDHWASDVLGGAVIGVLIGRALWYLNASLEDRNQSSLPAIRFFASTGYQQFSIQIAVDF
ncbi:MAG: phosphatase PAP2 family protein [Bacteriovoracia bacterium]